MAKTNKKRELPEYKKNFNDTYFLIMMLDDEVYTVYAGTLREILKFTTDSDNMGAIISRVIHRLRIDERDTKKIKEYYNIKLCMKKRGKKNFDKLVYSNKKDILYVTSNDIMYLIQKYKLNKDMRFLDLVCRLFDEDYKTKGNRDIDRNAKRISNVDMVKSIILEYVEYRPGVSTFLEDVSKYPNALRYILYTICKSYNKKEELIKLLKEETGLKNLLSDSTYETRKNDLGYFLRQPDYIDEELVPKAFIEDIIVRRIDSLLWHHKDVMKKRKEAAERKEKEAKKTLEQRDYELRRELLKQQEFDYNDYLIQEGMVPKNDNGEYMFDVVEDDYEAKNK